MDKMPPALPEFLKMPQWYPFLKEDTFPTGFARLSPASLEALKRGDYHSAPAYEAIEQLRPLLAHVPGNGFVGVDTCVPTDTERFEKKRGAVYSPESAWKFLCLSEKVRHAAQNDQVTSVFVRPFRRISKPREFRLFIIDGKLMAISQYHLIRHFRRLEGRKPFFWEQSRKLVERKLAGKLPPGKFVMDVYFTSGDEILILDLNAWGECSALMLRDWNRDWSLPIGIVLMPPPTTISGEVQLF